MERLEHPTRPYSPARPSQTKHVRSTEPLYRPGSKRDVGFSCFSSSSSALVHDTSTFSRKGTSTENIFFRGIQGERPQQSERLKSFQTTLCNRGWRSSCTELQPGSRVSIPGGPSAGPLWQVPDKGSLLVPAPSLRNDSFAARNAFPYSEGPGGQTYGKRLTTTNVHNDLRSHYEGSSVVRRGFNPLPTKDFHPNMVTDYTQNQLHNNKFFSLSSSDIRQSHYSQIVAHQRQFSDESPFYLRTRTAASTRTQSVESYYRSLQDLPSNTSKNMQHSTAPMACSPTNPLLESKGHSRYNFLASKHSLQTAELQFRQKPHWTNGNQPGIPSFLRTYVRQLRVPHSENKDCHGHPTLENGLSYDRQPSELSAGSCSSEDSVKRNEGLSNDTRRHFSTNQSNDHKVSLSAPKDSWVPQEDPRISPLKTPLLHSLAQESRGLSDRQPADTPNNSINDQYATTLHKEVQQKRAYLQKSHSTAGLTSDAQGREGDDWRSIEMSGVLFSSSYKDHLKEVQARVLQATSFQRRDLEPVGPEGSVAKTTRARKHFAHAQKTHSFSEPDNIDKVGEDGGPRTASSEERRRFFEMKPAFSRPVLKQCQGEVSNTDKHTERTSTTKAEALRSTEPTLLLERQRLGTFTEYQATWNNKKSLEAKTQGRYHSAESFLDAEAEEKVFCIHERSRSSPSAEFSTQNIPPSLKDLEAQQNSSTIRVKTERRQELQPAPSVTQRKDVVLPEHKATSGLLSLRPSPDCQHQAQTPQTVGLLPPSRPLLCPQTTFSSQEFLAGTEPDRLHLVSSSDFQHRVATPASTMDLSKTSGKLGEDTKQGKAPWCSFSDGARPPSPQLSLLRLPDIQPATSMQDDSPLQSVNDWEKTDMMENGKNVIRKVSISIVGGEADPHWEGRAYLSPDTEACGVFESPQYVTSQEASEHPSSSAFGVGADQDTGQDPAQRSDQESTSPGLDISNVDTTREELVRDVTGRDKSPVDMLVQSGRKTSMDLIATDKQIMEEAQCRRTSTEPRNAERGLSTLAAAFMVPRSSYYNTSAPKAELLIKMKDMQEQLEEQDSEDELDVNLQELISSLARKLEVLREARQSLQDDVEDNEALGREVEAAVQRLCQPTQLDKFRMFVGDLDKVVSLLLSLSGRLARVENALNSLEDEAESEEKQTLTDKRKLLMRQHEDARELKENLERRERLVSNIMEAHLDPESLEDYRHYVKMKSALIIEQRKLEDKIKLGEEQLRCLVDSLPPLL